MPAHHRAYGARQARQTAKLKADMIDGQPCARGGEPLYRWQLELPAHDPRSIDGDHVEVPHSHGGRDVDGLTCAHHNRQHGARLGNAARAHGGLPQPPRPSRDLAPQPKTSRPW